MDVDEEENDAVGEEDLSQDRETHLVRACAIKIHTAISQEPFRMEIYSKTDFFELAQSKT